MITGLMLVLLFTMWAAAPASTLDDVGGVMVYLMDWKYDDVAKECAFLGRYGFATVVISPPTENVVVTNRPWYERYQVISYKLQTRSGDKTGLVKMVEACSRHNVRVFVDIVLNNMADSRQDKVVGTAGSEAIPKDYEYPEFSRKKGHFNNQCSVTSFREAAQIRECEIEYLSDLSQRHPDVRERQVDLLNGLIDIGVAGFFVDKAKYMWPWDLAILQTRLHDIKWTKKKTRPVMVFNLEDPVIRTGEDKYEVISWKEYKEMGRVTDHKYGIAMAQNFMRTTNFFEFLKQDMISARLIPSKDALIYLSNVYCHTKASNTYLKYNERPALYKLASAFMLALNFGQPMVLSTYKMVNNYEKGGPPSDAQGQILSPGLDCSEGWNCEHRLPEIFRMALFRLECAGEEVTNIYGASKGQFAFARGKKGFVAFNVEETTNPWSQTFSTGLPKGEYCEVITGGMKGSGWSQECADQATRIKVDDTGSFEMEVPPMSVRAIHTWNMKGYKSGPGEGPPKPLQEARRGLLEKLKDLVFFSTTKRDMIEIFPSPAPPGNKA